LQMLRLLRLFVLTIVLGGCVTNKIEEPKFKILLSQENFELREYEPRIIAQTIVKGEFSEAPNAGFRRLADYIFGNNTQQSEIAMTAPVSQLKSSEKIAMTAPVSQEKSGDDSWIITFTMPRSYTMDKLPKPNNTAITLRQLPSAKFAVVRFSGLNSQTTVKEKTEALRNWMKLQSFKERGVEPIYARYNPPWTPWFWRRNEILIELE